MHELPLPVAASLITERLILKSPTVDDAATILDFRIATREHLQAWEPVRSAAFYTLAAVESQLRGMQQPHNQRSGQLLARLGFEREGLARAYLHINGAWADHVLTSLIPPRQAGDR